MDVARLPVLACELSALTEAERARRAVLAREILGAAIEVRALSTGYAVHIDANRASALQIEELIDLEERCCSFLRFARRVGAGDGRLVLEITGGPGAKEFIAAEFGIGDRRG